MGIADRSSAKATWQDKNMRGYEACKSRCTVRASLNANAMNKVFSKLELNQGYNQLELAPESRYITTFSTHLGLRRFTRLNFGISSGTMNLGDDTLLYGTTKEDHDTALRKTFQRLREKGLTLHKQKCVYG